MLENLSDSDVDVGVDAVKSGVAADPGKPAGTPDRDLPRGLHRRLFDHLSLFLCTRPSRDEWNKENWFYTQLNKEIHNREQAQKCLHIEFLQGFQSALKAVQNVIA